MDSLRKTIREWRLQTLSDTVPVNAHAELQSDAKRRPADGQEMAASRVTQSPSLDSLPPLPGIERKSSIEALEDLTSAVHSTAGAEALCRLRQSTSVSKLHRLARFLKLQRSPELTPRHRLDLPPEAHCLDLGGPLVDITLGHHSAHIKGLPQKTQWMQLIFDLRLKSAVRELSAYQLASSAHTPRRPPLKEDPPESSESLPESTKGPTLLLGLNVTHNLGFSWHLAHELLVNDDFVFETEHSVLGNSPPTGQQRLMRIFERAIRKQRCDAMRCALECVMHTDGYSPDEVEAARDKIKTLLNDILEIVCSAVRERAPGYQSQLEASLDAGFLLQMLEHRSYSPLQLRSLVELVVRAVREGAICQSICDSLQAWSDEVCASLATLSRFKEALDSIPGILLDMLQELKQQQLNEKNVKLKLMLPLFVRQGIEYERGLVQTALADQSLKLTKTVPFLDGARDVLEAAALPTDPSTVHLHALVSLLGDPDAELPETLAFDAERINTMRSRVRNLSFMQSFGVVITTFYEKMGVQLDAKEMVDFQEALKENIDDSRGAVQAVIRAGRLAHFIAVKKGKLPVGKHDVVPQLEEALRRSVKDARGSLRVLFTKRILQFLIAVLSQEKPKEAWGPGLVGEELKQLAGKLDKMYRHNNHVFLPLYTSILQSSRAQ